MSEHLASKESPVVAVGEIGLDFTRIPKKESQSWKNFQYSAFRHQLQIAKKADFPVIIHSRSTVQECLDILHEENFSPERALFHCFAEGPATIRTLLKAGVRFSFTGILTFRNAEDVRESARLADCRS